MNKHLGLVASSGGALFLLVGCASSPPAPAPAPAPAAPMVWDTPEWREAQEAKKRQGDILLAHWSECEGAAMRVVARTSIPAAEAVYKGYDSCSKEREEWISSQIGPGMSRQFVESVAHGSEHCSFTFWLSYIEHLRVASSLTTEQNAAWLSALQSQPRPACAGGTG